MYIHTQMFLYTLKTLEFSEVAGVVLWALVLITALFAAPVIHVYLLAQLILSLYGYVLVPEDHFAYAF